MCPSRNGGLFNSSPRVTVSLILEFCPPIQHFKSKSSIGLGNDRTNFLIDFRPKKRVILGYPFSTIQGRPGGGCGGRVTKRTDRGFQHGTDVQHSLPPKVSLAVFYDCLYSVYTITNSIMGVDRSPGNNGGRYQFYPKLA